MSPILRLNRDGTLRSDGDRRPHMQPARRWRSTARWQRLRAVQIARQPWCLDCGSRTDLTADHVVAVAAGGRWDDPANLTTRCRSCNSRKGVR